jgi:hypothetical protein
MVPPRFLNEKEVAGGIRIKGHVLALLVTLRRRLFPPFDFSLD